jgi:hypothetical protein
MKNAKLMVSAIGNNIYLGTMMKNSKFPVMNESRVDFTDEAIRAVVQHLMGMHKDSNGKNDGYEFPDLGTLRWHPKVKDIESNEQPSVAAAEE